MNFFKLVSILGFLALLSIADSSFAGSTSLVSIRCNEGSEDAKIYIDGQYRGDCSNGLRLDLPLAPGTYQLKAIMAEGGGTERTFAKTISVGVNSIQRISVASEKAAAAAADPAMELAYWQSVADSGDFELIQSYIDKYPKGVFVLMAKKKVEALEPPEEARRYGQFIEYKNGETKDTKTGLIWSAINRDDEITWVAAKRYCENLNERQNKSKGWRMPHQEELELYMTKHNQLKEYKTATRLWAMEECEDTFNVYEGNEITSTYQTFKYTGHRYIKEGHKGILGGKKILYCGGASTFQGNVRNTAKVRAVRYDNH